ncbi:type I polyketide synthase [Amycolatopsis sp. NPDC005003]
MTGGLDLAIVGMAGRFPGSANVGEFWQNLCAGVSGTRRLTDEELRAAGVREELLTRPDYVRVGAVLDGEDLFDAEFFGYSHGEARIIDPQQRLFLECAAAAVEDAGYDAARYEGAIGVYASASANTYLLNNVWPDRSLHRTYGGFTLLLGGEKDYLASRVAYKLGLRGPAVTVQTACSSSLVAVHLAGQALVAGECDMAIAGGVTVRVPQRVGHLPHESGIGSPDGVCRAFDADGQGTLTGNGLGAVLLKRLDDAVADGDTVTAVIRGSAVTNDGSAKVGFTAPSITGQAAAIRAALEVAEVSPHDVGYVEAHGTATPLGDPIEVAALTEAFGGPTTEQWCALGSVKTNIGHLDAAAGITGLIKAALCVRDGLVPPSLHFRRPNPHIDFARSPFFVNTVLRDWPTHGPRTAGVNSMGIGGTNVHVTLAQAPDPPAATPCDRVERVVVSARTGQALDAATRELADHLAAQPELSLADVAWTTQAGRTRLPHRRVVRASTTEEASRALRSAAVTGRSLSGAGRTGPVWMFAGQGSQFPGMAEQFHRDSPVFRTALGRCAEILAMDLAKLLYGPSAVSEAELAATRLAQPVVFSVGYALAESLRHEGVRPGAVLGHSVGEYVAAQQAGIFSLAGALRLVAARGNLVDRLPRGAMASVALPAEELEPLLDSGLSIAAVNAPGLTVAAGEATAVTALVADLTERGVKARRLRTSHAFHTAAMSPIMAEFGEIVRLARPRPPTLPMISNVSGDFLTDEEATDPSYWAEHLRAPVRFAAGIATLLADGYRIFVDVNTRFSLGPLVRNQSAESAAVALDDDTADHLWTLGVPVDWRRSGRRVPLPTYPFQRTRHWVGPPDPVAEPAAEEVPGTLETVPGTTAKVVADIWRELLGVAEVTVDDDFFVLGGHSLLASQVAARVRDVFGVQVALRDLFTHSTPASLAMHIGDRSAGATATSADAETGDGTELPLTDAQRSIWFLQQRAPNSSFYTLGNRIVLRGPLRVDLLQAAVTGVVHRHEALRATFPLAGRSPVHRILPTGDVPVPVVDLSGSADHAIALSTVEEAVLSGVRDVMTRTPLRAAIVRHAPEHHELLVALHHIVADYWSSTIVVTELLTSYQALLSGGPAQPPPATRYADFVRRQVDKEHSPAFARQLDYWTTRFREPPPPLALPADRRPAGAPGHGGAHQRVAVPAHVGARVAALAGDAAASPYMVLLAAYAVQLHALTEQRDLCIGTFVGNRADTGLESVVGLLSTTVALRTSVDPQWTFRDLVGRVRSICLDAYDNLDVPVERLLRQLDVSRTPGRNPLFRTMLVLETAPGPRLGFAAETGLEITIDPLDTGGSKQELMLVLYPRDGGFDGFLEYSTELFTGGTAARLATGFTTVTDLVTAHPDEPLTRLLARTEITRTT